MKARFFKLFGCEIPIPSDDDNSSHVEERDLAPHDISPHSGALVPVHASATLPMNTTTDDDGDADTDPYKYHSDQVSSEIILSPEPLQWYNPYENCMHALSSAATCSKPKRKYQKRKRADDDNNLERARLVRRRRREPLQPQNDLSPEFLQMISPAQPFFLYRKHLEWTDLDKNQNRLLVNDTDRLKEFLTEEEMAKSRVNVIAVDANGREYKFTLSEWGEKDEKKKKKSVVFNTEWFRMVRSNGVLVYDYVDLWGFRRGPTGEFCLAVAFSRA